MAQDENMNTEESTETRQERINRMKGVIYDYDQITDPEAKKLMEKYMDPIDRRPNDFDVILNYGHEPLKELGDFALKVLEMQSRFDSTLNVVSDAMEQLKKRTNEVDISKFTKSLRALAKASAKAGGAGANGIGKLLSAFTEAITHEKANMQEDEKLLAEMQESFPALAREMKELRINVEKAEKGLVDVIEAAYQMGDMRMKTARELALYIGAGPEVLRRYSQLYIPEAENELLDNQGSDVDVEALQTYLNEVLERKDDFNEQVERLRSSYQSSLLAAQQLKQLIKTMEDQRKILRGTLYNDLQEWYALLGEAALAASSLKVGRVQKQAKSIGAKAADQNQKALEQVSEINRQTRLQGAMNPDHLLELTDRVINLIEQEENDRQARRQLLDANRQKLQEAANRLIEGVSNQQEKARQERLLEASEDAERAEAQQAKKKAGQVQQASNDNEDGDAEKPAVKSNPAATGRNRRRGIRPQP